MKNISLISRKNSSHELKALLGNGMKNNLNPTTLHHRSRQHSLTIFIDQIIILISISDMIYHP